MSISKAKFLGALKSLSRVSDETRELLLRSYTFIAFHTLAHGNKAPLQQLKDANGIAAWIKAGGIKASMTQDVRYRTATEDGWKLAEAHALSIVETMLDQKKDESDEAKAKREAQKAKRIAEAQKLKATSKELEEAQAAQEKLELELAKAKSKLREAQPKSQGRVKRQDAEKPGQVEQEERYRLIHVLPQGDGKDDIVDLTPEEFEVAKAAIAAHRASQIKAVKTGTQG